jgi:hypothetical protein
MRHTKTLLPLLLLFCWIVAVGKPPSSTKAKPLGNVTGHYRMRYQEFRNRIDVQQLPDAKVKFDLLALWVSHYNAQNVHNGTAQGVVSLENGVAMYEDGSCRLKIEFFPNKLRVTQSEGFGDCGFGANVTATGTYRKVDNKKPKFDF